MPPAKGTPAYEAWTQTDAYKIFCERLAEAGRARRTKERCSIEGCGGIISTRGWCMKHYTMWRKHGDPLHAERAAAAKPTVCGAEDCDRLPDTWGLCHRCYMRAYRDANPDYVARKNVVGRQRYAERREHYHDLGLKYKFGLTVGEYTRMLERQNGVCAICEQPPGRKRLAVDHDRKCCPDVRSCGKCIRGLLCDRCNRAIGLLGDNADAMKRAAVYVSELVRGA